MDYILSHNNIHITFPHLNHQIINALHNQPPYNLILANQHKTTTPLTPLTAINTPQLSHEFKQPILQPHIITTPVALNILPIIPKSFPPLLKHKQNHLNILPSQ
ncbi:mannitol dehydrogenase family protein, partial [Staphylococcus haemolyticus]